MSSGRPFAATLALLTISDAFWMCVSNPGTIGENPAALFSLLL
jgi:hypothetical protein